MIARFLGAIQFLTTAPIRRSTVAPGRSAVFFPIVGAALGFTGAVVLVRLLDFFPPAVASILVLVCWALLTGGLHEDGFADVIDAFRAGRPRDRVLAILKDSRIGAHGALALILMTLLRWHSLASIAAPPLLSLPAVFAVARGAMICLAWITAPAGTGLGFEFSRHLTSGAAIITLVLCGMIAAAAPAGLLLAWGAVLIVIAAKIYFVRGIGGVNGDCLGATAFVVETWGLVLYSCTRCM